MKIILTHIPENKACIINVVFLVFLSFSKAFSTTYNVATNGNDDNTDTKELPFLTIGKGASTAKARDIVIIKSGTYKPVDRIQPANSGTQTAPITFMAEVKDEAIIDGSMAASPTTSDRLGLFTILGYILIQIQIRLEEEFSKDQHGQKYTDYKQKVRRLI